MGAITRTAREAKEKRMRRIRAKVIAAGAFARMLRRLQEEEESAELMWKKCFEGLGSMSVNSVAFARQATRSLGLGSWRLGGAPCGSASKAARVFRQRSQARMEAKM